MRKFTILSFAFLVFACTLMSRANQSIYFLTLLRDTLPIVDTNRQLVIDDKVFEKVEVEASFRGGDEAWVSFLQSNLKPEIPAKKKAPVGLYTVLVQFIVDKEGNVSNIKALTNHGFGMEQEVIRVLKKSPRWLPAVQDGRKVKAYRKQPITFSISEK